MKKNITIILSILYATLFTACSTKVQNDISKSSNEDISKLLNKLIKKEKEINKLTKQLEECKRNNN